jgi:glycosyltransferase involved in cell wall biosynthesis
VHQLATDHDLTVFALRLPVSQSAYELLGARVIPLGFGSTRRRGTPALWRAAVRAIADEHARGPFDLLHAVQASEAGFVGALAARRLRRPLAVHVGGGELVSLPQVGYGSQRVAIERTQVAVALRSADLITAGSRGLVVRCRQWVGPGRAERVRWAPYGVDVVRFRPRRFPRHPTLLHVADLNPVKDQATLLQAFAGVAARLPDAELHLVGGGPELARLRRLERELGLGGRIRWWGQIPHSAIHWVFARAGALAVSSLHEAQGIVLAEAAAAGLPIASTAVGMAADLPHEAVRLASPGDATGLTQAMLAALQSGAPRQRARRAGRDAAVRLYDWPVCAHRWSSLYDGVATAPLRQTAGGGMLAPADGR